MKNSLVLLMLFSVFFGISQRKVKNDDESTYLIVKEDDNLIEMESNRYLFLFLNEKGLSAKKAKDSIRSRLKYFHDSDDDEIIIIKDQPVLDPWLELGLSVTDKMVKSSDFNKLNITSRREFINSYHCYKNKFALIKKDSTNNLFIIYELHTSIYE